MKFCHVGEMSRSLGTTVKEIEYAIRLRNINKVLAKHAINTGHLSDMTNIESLGHDIKRKILDVIKNSQEITIILNSGCNLSKLWKNTIAFVHIYIFLN